jgi:2'-5' RNA ligase
MVTDLSKLSGSGTVRLFLAVEVPNVVRASVARAREALPPLRGITWVQPELVHVTVRFLGPVPTLRVSDVEEAARYAAEGVQPHIVHLHGLGAFPNERQPRVLWIGLRDDEGLHALTLLHGWVEAALEARGFGREDRAFSPHLTIARTRDDMPSRDRRALGEAVQEAKERVRPDDAFRLDTLTVMRSDLSPSGPRYTPLARVPLGKRE